MRSEIADQAERRQALDPLHSFIIQAPAGSGKTGLLTQRFLVLLAIADQPEEIIAITFTRKAASEMKQRISRALWEAERQPLPADDYERQTWELARRVLARDHEKGWQLLDNPSRLRIQTIDSLCAQLVGQMPVCSEQGILPAVTEKADTLYMEAARLTVLALENDAEWTAAIAHLIQHLDNRLDKLQQLIAGMLAQRDQWLRHIVDIADTEDIRAHLESALTSQAEAVLRKLVECAPAEYQTEIVEMARFAADQLGTEIGNKTKIGYCTAMQEWPGGQVGDRLFWEGIADLLLTQAGDWRKRVTKDEGFPSAASVRDAGTKKRFTEMKQHMLDLLTVLQEQESFHQHLLLLRQLPPDRYEEAEWETLQALFKLLKVAAGYLVLVFQQHSQVDFTEITMAAIRALGEPEAPTDLALALDHKISHILVDEFQDTSFNQAELLSRLTAGWQSGDGRTLFLVGDPMQSIYRFRQAEVGLFLDIRDRGVFGQIPMKFLRLSVNFRSQQRIVDWINQHFPRILPAYDDATAGAVSYAQAEAFHPISSDEAVTVYPYLQKDDWAEAEQVVAIIHQAKAVQPDGKIAVLVRNRTHLASIVIRLKQAGLRFQAVEIEQLGQRPVIQDLIALTRALLHPADRIAWLAVLRAPFCGLSLYDLHVIANDSPGYTVIDLLHGQSTELSAEGRQRLERVGPVLDQAMALYDRIPLRRSVEGTWIQLGGPACVADETGLADAEVYFQLLEQFDTAGYRPDVQELEEQLVRLFALPDVTADDTLQLMTLHKAKGLEFDTVILPGLGKRSRRNQERLLNWLECPGQSGAADLLCAPISASGNDKNPISTYILSVEKNKTALEEARLLYVAATRAKHRLHLLGHIQVDPDTLENVVPDPPADTLLAKLWSAVAVYFQSQLADVKVMSPAVPPGINLEPQLTGRICLASDWQPPAVPSAIEVPVFLEKIDSVTESVDFDWAGEPARLVGMIVHRLLHHIGSIGIENLSQHDLSRFEQAGRLLLMQSGIAPHYLDAAVQQVSTALNTMCVDDTIGRWILSNQHQDAHCEWALSALTSDAAASLHIIDRTFVDADGIRWIIDYKTGSHAGGGIDEFLDREQLRYRPQLERYADIMQRMEKRPIHLAVYFPLLGKWREWAYQLPLEHTEQS